MLPLTIKRIGAFERGLVFRDEELVRVAQPGWTWCIHRFDHTRIEPVSVRDPWLKHRLLDVLVRSGQLGDEVQVIDLKDHERAIVWIDGRLSRVLGPGLHVVWTVLHEVTVEVLDARQVRLQREDLGPLAEASIGLLQVAAVEAEQLGLLFVDGSLQEVLKPGRYAFWRGHGNVTLRAVDLRERMSDVSGQEIMTEDKVTLRMNAVATWRVRDAVRAVAAVADYEQVLYREAQLALRAVIGTRELDAVLANREEVAAELLGVLREQVKAFGLEVTGVGIRDVILPGEMKNLMNKVTEARKAAEAALITRREETAAMRSQANTARLLEQSPTLMRLRELEVLERISEKSQLQVVLGESGLTDRVMKLL
jgi:regulator of protease activity HflC (stomatin/prohibitin superfamily)